MESKNEAFIQVEYVIEIQTAVQTVTQAQVAPEFSIKLVDEDEFQRYLEIYYQKELLTAEDEAFWGVLFGNFNELLGSSGNKKPQVRNLTVDSCNNTLQFPELILFAKVADLLPCPGSKNSKNPHVRYLTVDSCNKILEFRELFVHGIDFQHLPPGFLLVKNPKGGGVCDVLHYSDAYKAFRQEEANDVFAFTLMNQKAIKEAPEEKTDFTGDQADWYQFLLKYRVNKNGVYYCTESQLKDAFISFSTLIDGMGLTFYPAAFKIFQEVEDINPILLIGRWVTVLSNAQLKKEDRKKQWELLAELPLCKGQAAIRAITDYAYDRRPCGFVRPDMQLEEALMKNGFPNGIQPEDKPEKIGYQGLGYFWRYVAYQPRRNSMAFYEQALERIDKVATLNNTTRAWMRQFLAESTTGVNYRDKTEPREVAEAQEFLAWDNLCYAIEQGPLNLKGERYTTEVLTRLYALPQLPNIAFLETIAAHIKENVLHTNYLVVLANRLTLGVLELREGFYQGAKFYYIDHKWKALSANRYVDLQYEFYRETGGQYLIEKPEHVVYGNESSDRPVFYLIAPLLSTFNLLKMEDYQAVLKAWPVKLDQQTKVYLRYCLGLFWKVDNNQGLTPQKLAEVIDFVVKAKIPEGQDYHLFCIDYLRQHFNANFPTGYLDKLHKTITDSIFGLTYEQQQRVQFCLFPEQASAAISSFLSEFVKQRIPNVDDYLAEVLEKLVNLRHILLEEDFLQLTQDLDRMRLTVASDYAELPLLLDELISKRSLEGFSQIQVRNEIEKSRDCLLKKFRFFIQEIKPLSNQGQLTLDTLALQEALASIVLNLDATEIKELAFTKIKIEKVISLVDKAAQAHPQVRHYLLQALNHLPNKESQLYLMQLTTFTENISKIAELFEPGQSEKQKENMFVMYSLLAYYYDKPAQLNALSDKIVSMTPEERALILRFVSHLADSKQSLDQLGELIAFITANPTKKAAFIRLLQSPPYPGVTKLLEWLQKDDYGVDYTSFSLQPFGPRKLEYGFKYSQYKKQRQQFGELASIFTDELGAELHWQLHENRDKSLSVLIAEFSALRQALPFDNNAKLRLLCLSVEIMARTASQQSLDKTGEVISQEVNTTQIMTLYAKLTHPNKRLISEIDTGEGKSRIMMLLSACQAAQGKTVDFLTSSMQLAERDYLSYKQFFTALSIPSSIISLNTPAQLYQKGGVNFSDNNQLPLLRNRSDIENTPFDFLDKNEEKRCLLVDEADKFLHDKSHDSFNYASPSKMLAGFVWIYPHLVKYLQTLPSEGNKPFDPELHVEAFIRHVNNNEINRNYKGSLAILKETKPEQLKTWLRSAKVALLMEANKKYLCSESKPENLYLLRDSKGHLRYSRKIFVLDNGRPVEGSTFFAGVQQCLCAKENLALGYEAFVILPENELLRSSFPVSFVSQYDKGFLYGVSGTTRSEAPLADPETINYNHFVYLKIPREKPLIREDKPVWLAKDETQQLVFIKRSILEKMRAGLPVLLICKDDQQSDRLHKKLLEDKAFVAAINAETIQRVHGLTPDKEELKAIQSAGKPKVLTISTAGMFGRGVDINADNLSVLVAYIPSEEDEIQIKGRTGRIGKPGEYRMITNAEDSDTPIHGRSYNVQSEVVKSQKEKQRSAAFKKEVSSLYALFLEEVTLQCLGDLNKASKADYEKKLLDWQGFLGDMQRDWEPNRQKLLDAVVAQNQKQFEALFTDFTSKWLEKLPIKQVQLDANKQKQQLTMIYKAICAQDSFFTPKPQPIREQSAYDPADDGQARVYRRLFEQTRATLRGERPMFANTRAAWEGRGYLFPDLIALLKGERQLFANLRATIACLLEAWFGNKNDKDQENELEIPPKPVK